jgi:hypothetical protein
MSRPGPIRHDRLPFALCSWCPGSIRLRLSPDRLDALRACIRGTGIGLAMVKEIVEAHNDISRQAISAGEKQDRKKCR